MENSDKESSTRVANVNAAISELKTQLIAERDKWKTQDQPEVNLSVVEFSSGSGSSGQRSDDSYQDLNYASSSVAKGWSALSDFSYTLSNSSGGTNWQAGVYTAESLMKEKVNDGYRKYVTKTSHTDTVC